MTKWNDIPYNDNDTPEQKAEQFDAQVLENGGDPEVTKTWTGDYEEKRK